VRQSQPPHHRRSTGKPSRPDGPGYQPPRWPARPPIGTTTVPAVQATMPPVAWRRPVRRIALDSLEDPYAEAPPEFSWRSLLSRLAGIHLGPSRSEIYELELRDRARAPLGSAFPIAVLNLKGGVGKTSVVEALGSTFADARTDRVIAVDVDAGDLADRHGYKNQLSLVDLLANRSVTRYQDVRAYTRRNRGGLELLALPNYSDTDWLIERDDVLRAFSILRNHYSVVLMDCGKALKSAVTEAVLLESRALVVVTNACVDAIEKTRTTIEWLSRNGYQRQIESTVLVINHIERAKPHAVNDARKLGRAMHMQARVWYQQRRLEDAKSEALDALEIYEKSGAVRDAGVCRDLLRAVERTMRSRSTGFRVGR